MQFKTETKVGIFIVVALSILIYMTFYLGVFRVNLNQYNSYDIYFDDLSGLSVKADVKIAGVKVGWVDDIQLVEDGRKAKTSLKVSKRYPLREDSYAEVRQEGLLGTKYLEIYPGHSMKGDLPSGSTFTKEGRSAVAIEDLLFRVQKIADNVESVTDSLKIAMGGPEKAQKLGDIVDNINNLTSKLAQFTEVLSKNSENVDGTLRDFRNFTHKLDTEVLPTFQKSIENISDVFDKDFRGIADGIQATTKSLTSITKKVEDGEGLIGKLVHDETIFDDLKLVSQTLRESAELGSQMEIVLDSHFEAMYRPAEFYKLEDSKGYFDIRLHTSEDKFYLIQVIGSQKGTLDRTKTFTEYYNADGKQLTQTNLDELAGSFSVIPYETRQERYSRNVTKYGFQFGKIFNDLAFRFGIFENMTGMALDYEIPFKSDKFRWVMTFEAFDFHGQDRYEDTRPHFKWVNRVFVMRNFYMAFGADDFISRRNANAFYGGGLRFNDDDFKHILSKLGFIASAMR